jgi:hypothetical protein
VTSREDHIGVVAGFLRAECEVVRIHTYAVTAYQPRGEVEEIPLGRSCREHLLGINPEPVKNGGELVHESNVQVALRILDHFGGFRDPD